MTGRNTGATPSVVDAGDRALRLGLACSWWRPREPTWSYTPMSLRAGLIDAGTTVLDIDAQPPLWLQAPLAAALSAAGQRPWKYASTYRRIENWRVRRAVRRLRPQAVLEVADVITATDVPSFAYQDMNIAVAMDYHEQLGPDLVSTLPASLDTLRRLAGDQARALQQLEGVFVMGTWFRDYLVDRHLLPANRVHVVGGGIAPVYRLPFPRQPRPSSERRRLLFVGGEFRRKGGDWVVDAVGRLNRGGGRRLELSIVGPRRWPLSTPIPEWVRFLGPQPRERVAELFREHDLLVLPSRFEAYGLVFLEARANGLPCIGRDAFAMPELIEPGVGGQLWRSADVDDLAALIDATLDDDVLHQRCARDAAAFAAQHDWACVARRIRQHLPD